MSTFTQTFDPAELLSDVDLSNVRRYAQCLYPTYYDYGASFTQFSGCKEYRVTLFIDTNNCEQGYGDSWQAAFANLAEKLSHEHA